MPHIRHLPPAAGSALLIVDVQRTLFEALPRPFEADAVVARINSLAARARAGTRPVIFVQHEAPGTALEFGSAGWQLQHSLDVQPQDHFVRKTTPDSFLRTKLQEFLDRCEVTHLVVCGYASEFCVDTTVRSAAASGYSVTLVSDAHTTHDKPHALAADIRRHENGTLPEITSFGPTIQAIVSEQIIFDGQRARASLRRQ